jgi:hypothetical protein
MALSTGSVLYLQGNAYGLTTSTTSQNIVVSAPGSSVNAIQVENLDTTNDVFVTWSFTGAATAVLPTSSAPQLGVAVQNGSSKVIQIAPNGQYAATANVAVIAYAGTPAITVTVVA